MANKKNMTKTVPVLSNDEIEALGLLKPGTVAKTLNEVNGRPIGSKVKIISVENKGKVYRAEFVLDPQVIRVEVGVLAT